MGELKSSGKSFEISKWEVQQAWEKVKANKGAAGVDGCSIEEFEKDLRQTPVQDLESDVFGHLLSAAGAGGGDTEAAWRWDRILGVPTWPIGSLKRWWQCGWSGR